MNQITELRQRNRLSKMALSRELGVAVQTIRAWEAGRSWPGGMARRLIKEIYGIEIEADSYQA